MNRALIVQSYFEDLIIHGHSQCDDVVKMQKALFAMKQNEPMDCGAAGTTLRFLMGRASRLVGESTLFGDERLFRRPHQGLIDLLKALSVSVDFPEKNYMRIRSQSWKIPDSLDIDLTQSSQFASSLILNAWSLPKDLHLKIGSSKNSYSYLKMTMDLVQQLGMKVENSENEITIPKGQTINIKDYKAEPDMSSCFCIAAFAALAGIAEIHEFPKTSLQPDFAFMDILQKMNVPVSYDEEKRILKINKAYQLKAINIDLTDNPDMFPVLAVMMSQAEGVSQVTGIEHLVHKESNRIRNTQDLIASVGGKSHYENKVFQIKGHPEQELNQGISFDPDEDHRMAMAAALFNQPGAGINISHTSVVNKSFPEFWSIVGES